MIDEKEDVGIFLLSQKRDDSVKLQLIRCKLKDNTGFMSAPGAWNRSEAAFYKILNDDRLWTVLASATVVQRRQLLKILAGDDGIPKPEIESVDLDAPPLQVLDFALIQPILACLTNVAQVKGFICAVPAIEPKHFASGERDENQSQQHRRSRFRGAG